VLALLDEFRAKGPFASTITTDAALGIIEGFKETAAGLKEQDEVIRKGLIIFRIDQPPSPDMIKLEAVSYLPL